MAELYNRGMTVRVQQVDGEYRIVLTPETMEALHLTNGAEVELRPVASSAKQDGPVVRYATREEAFGAYRATLAQHEESYRELAK